MSSDLVQYVAGGLLLVIFGYAVGKIVQQLRRDSASKR